MKLLTISGLLWLLLPTTAVAQTVEYIHTDALGSAVAITDSSRGVREIEEYEPFGSSSNRANDDRAGFTGHPADSLTSLVYMQQRYYDPAIGRFISSDPVTVNLNSGANFPRYAYANNNPYRFIDPDGRASVNGFHPDEAITFDATEAFNVKGWFTHGSHGNANLITNYDQNRQVSYPYGRALTELQNHGFARGQSLFSIACRFGMTDPASGRNLAQTIANENKSRVYAADGYVNYEQRGNTVTLTVWSGLNKTGSQGAFQLFKPGGSGPSKGSEIVAIKINVQTKAIEIVRPKIVK